MNDEVSNRLLSALYEREPAHRAHRCFRADNVTGEINAGREAVTDRVRSGEFDIGLVLRADAEPLDQAGGFGPAPLLLMVDPARGAAEPMLAGEIRRAYFSALPDVAMGNVISELENQFLTLDDEQHESVARGPRGDAGGC